MPLLRLETFKKSLTETYNDLVSQKDSISYYDFSYGLLKDGGVKSKIIKKYLPLINQQVNRYLQMMDFYINFTLLFTWREVARMKNSVNTNLLIMDEIFDSSLDGFGTEEFLKIIKYVIKDANVFVISHKVGLEDRFDSVTKFEKVKGFSSIVSS